MAYIERTTDYVFTATTIATSTDMFSSDLTFTADGTSSYLVVFYSGAGQSHTGASGVISVFLTDGGNNGLGKMTSHQHDGAAEISPGGIAQRYYTPASGSRSLNVRATVNNATGTLLMSDGNGTNNMPGYLAVFGPILT